VEMGEESSAIRLSIQQQSTTAGPLQKLIERITNCDNNKTTLESEIIFLKERKAVASRDTEFAETSEIEALSHVLETPFTILSWHGDKKVHTLFLREVLTSVSILSIMIFMQ